MRKDEQIQKLFEELNSTKNDCLESTSTFLRAVEIYDTTDDGNRIIEQFLSVMLGHDSVRDQISKANAEETVQLITTFRSTMSNFIGHVALLRLACKNAEDNSVISTIEDFLKAFQNNQDKVVLPSDPSSLFEGLLKPFKESRNALDEAAERNARKLIVNFKLVTTIQTAATSLVMLRQATLQEFRSEHIDFNVFTALREQLTEQLEELTSERAYELLTDALRKLWEEVEKRIPVVVATEQYQDIAIPLVLWLVRTLWTIIRQPRIDHTVISPTDLMHRLLIQLRKENELYIELDKAYQNAIGEIDPHS